MKCTFQWTRHSGNWNSSHLQNEGNSDDSMFPPELLSFPHFRLSMEFSASQNRSTGNSPSWVECSELPSTGASLEGFMSTSLSLACGVQMSQDWLSFELPLTIQFFFSCASLLISSNSSSGGGGLESSFFFPAQRQPLWSHRREMAVSLPWEGLRDGSRNDAGVAPFLRGSKGKTSATWVGVHAVRMH